MEMKAQIKEIKNKKKSLQRLLNEFESNRKEKVSQEERDANFQRFLELNSLQQVIVEKRTELKRVQVILDEQLPWKLRIKIAYALLWFIVTYYKS
jgi:hypothetical protein